MNIEHQQLKLVLENNFSSSVGSYGVATLISLILFYLTESFTIFLWFAFMLIMTSMRAWVNHNILQLMAKTGFKKSYMQIILIMIILSAIGWALLVLFFIEESQPAANAFILITVTGIMLTSMSTLIHVKKFYFSFAIISITPVIITLAFMDDITYRLFLLQVVLFLLFVLKNGDMFNKKLRHNLELLEKNKSLIEDLKLQKQQAEQISAMKSQFLANVSHEIRTPLNGIVGFLQMLKIRETDSTKKGYIDIISQSSDELMQIINGILDFSKLENKQVELEEIEFDPKLLLQSCVDLFSQKAAEKSINIELTEVNPLPKTILSDPLKLKQVVNNLLSNAVKFSSHNGNVNLIAEYLIKEEKLQIFVVDQGIGISEENLQKVFDSFTQADNSITREYGGTGLGLAISMHLVELMGGELKAESTLGVGSKFSFKIKAPLINASVTTTPETNLNLANSEQSKQILIVEDNLINQKLIAEFLNHFGYQYDIVNDGVEAVEAFKFKRYQAILMDENMPNMSGSEATQTIREIEKQENLVATPIIAVTANALQGDRERLLQSGMDDYIAKPIKPDELKSSLQRFLR